MKTRFISDQEEAIEVLTLIGRLDELKRHMLQTYVVKPDDGRPRSVYLKLFNPALDMVVFAALMDNCDDAGFFLCVATELGDINPVTLLQNVEDSLVDDVVLTGGEPFTVEFDFE